MKTHPLNVSYLVVGLAFLGIAGSWALDQAGVIQSADVEWLLPLTLVIAGAIGLVAFAARGLGNKRSEETTYDAPTYAPPTYEEPTYDSPADPTEEIR